MNQKISISGFFPCYNDAGTIASMVVLMNVTLQEITDDYEIIVIDDGSTDHSRTILQELQKQYSRLRLIFHDQNKGYGAALRSGFKAATKDYIFYTDGDFQYDVSELKLLLSHMVEGVDIVNGYKIIRADPFYRVWIAKVYHHLMSFLFRFKLRDVDCDFRLIRKSSMDKLNLKYKSGVICVEMIRKMHRMGFHFEEVAVSHFFRAYGHSQFFNFRRIIKVGVDIIALFWDEIIIKSWRKGIKNSSAGNES